MPDPEERPRDESQDLDDHTDDRDRGYGVVVDAGEIVQHDPPGEDSDDD